MELEFNEDKAIKYIKSQLPIGVNYDDDDILNVIDIIFDYYEDNNLLEIDCDLDDSDDNDKIKYELILHVSKLLNKDPYNQIRKEHIDIIVCAELAYEQTIGFEE